MVWISCVCEYDGYISELEFLKVLEIKNEFCLALYFENIFFQSGIASMIPIARYQYQLILKTRLWNAGHTVIRNNVRKNTVPFSRLMSYHFIFFRRLLVSFLMHVFTSLLKLLGRGGIYDKYIVQYSIFEYIGLGEKKTPLNLSMIISLKSGGGPMCGSSLCPPHSRQLPSRDLCVRVRPYLLCKGSGIRSPPISSLDLFLTLNCVMI